MPLVSIRYATQKDAGLIADLSRQTFYEAFASQNTKENMEKFMNEQFSKAALSREVGAPGNIFFLAYDSEDPVGYVKMRESINPQKLDNARAIEIARIYATTHSIGKGVGKILMQRCIDIALERKKDIIWLGVWEHNQRAIEFYVKWGFEKFDTHTFMLGDDPQTDWLMKKEPLTSS